MKKEKVNNYSENEYYNLFKNIPRISHSERITEWKQEGDYFKKFSMYDEKFNSISSGNTTLICKK